jgi:hypothetical protein
VEPALITLTSSFVNLPKSIEKRGICAPPIHSQSLDGAFRTLISLARKVQFLQTKFRKTDGALMKKLAAVVGSLVFSLSAQVFAQAPVATQDLFSSKVFLRKTHKKDHSIQFEVCERGSKSCRILTKEISYSELKSEQALLEKQSQILFRSDLAPGTVLFSETMTCTIAGSMIPSVPSFISGVMLCYNSASPKSQTMQTTDLLLNIMALDKLTRDMGEPMEAIAHSEEGEVYVGNLDLIFNYLKNRYPPL